MPAFPPSGNRRPEQKSLLINLRDFDDLDSLDLLWKESNILRLQKNDSIKAAVKKTISVIQKEFEVSPEKINPHRVIILQNIHCKIHNLAFGKRKKITQKTHDATTIKEIKRLDSIVDEVLKLTEDPDEMQKEFYQISKPNKAYKIGMRYIDIQKTTGVSISLLNHWAIKFLNKAADLYIDSGDIEKGIEIRVELSKLNLDPESAFNNLNKRLAEAPIIKHPLLGECDFGITLSGSDSQLIKRGTIHVRDISIEGVVHREFTFKAIEEKCANIRKTMELISFSPKMKSYLQQAGICGKISCTEEEYSYRKKNQDTGEFELDTKNEFSSMGTCLKIKFGSLCEIYIGVDPKYGSMHNRVVIRMHPQVDSVGIQKLFALIGLSGVTTRSTDYDLTRYKLNALTHYFYPRVASKLETDPNYFHVPLKRLLNILDKADPEIRKMHAREFPNLQWEEIAPGEHVLRLKRSSEALKKMGAKGFLAGFSGSYENAGKAVASVVQSGAFSSQVRFAQGLLLGGGSSEVDHRMNSADSIFTRLVVENSLKEPIDRCQFSGVYQLVFSLELSECMPYCYSEDAFGCRNRMDPQYGKAYDKRPSLNELVKDSQKKWLPDNEVMFKRRVDSKYVKGITYVDPRNEIVLVIEKGPGFPAEVRSLEQKKLYVSQNADIVIETLKDIEIKKIIEEITTNKDHWAVQSIIDQLTDVNLFPKEIGDPLGVEKKRYLFQHLMDPPILAEIETLFFDRERHDGKSIREHWCKDPKQVLITELQKLGYTDKVNGIPFDSFIMEKEKFDEEMFSRC